MQNFPPFWHSHRLPTAESSGCSVPLAQGRTSRHRHPWVLSDLLHRAASASWKKRRKTIWRYCPHGGKEQSPARLFWATKARFSVTEQASTEKRNFYTLSSWMVSLEGKFLEIGALGVLKCKFSPHFGTPTAFSTVAHRPSVIPGILDTAAAAFWVLRPFQKGTVPFGKVKKGFPGLGLSGKHRTALVVLSHPAWSSTGFAFGASPGCGMSLQRLRCPSELPMSPHTLWGRLSSVLTALVSLPPSQPQHRSGELEIGCTDMQTPRGKTTPKNAAPACPKITFPVLTLRKESQKSPIHVRAPCCNQGQGGGLGVSG